MSKVKETIENNSEVTEMETESKKGLQFKKLDKEQVEEAIAKTKAGFAKVGKVAGVVGLGVAAGALTLFLGGKIKGKGFGVGDSDVVDCDYTETNDN